MLLCVLASCQAQSYKISGTAEGMNDGDTIFLTTDMLTGLPQDTIIVKDGKFATTGTADSVQLAMLYSATRNEINTPFFLEPGNISIALKETPGESRVGGTKCNNQWQKLNDSVMVIGREINRIAENVYGGTMPPDEQRRGMEAIEKLNKRFADVVVKSAEENTDNEFGYFLLSYYPEEIIDNATRLRLIGQMSEEFQKRPSVRKMKEAIAKAAKTAEGSQLPEFSQPAPDGEMVSITEEVKKNKLTIIDFWASWCGPCRKEMPFMVELYNKYKDKGLGIVGVSLDENSDAWQGAIKQLGMPWPQMSDLKGWKNAAAEMFNVTSIPQTIVVDGSGKILRRGLRGQELEMFVADNLK